jgi:hypothetical protein
MEFYAGLNLGDEQKSNQQILHISRPGQLASWFTGIEFCGLIECSDFARRIVVVITEYSLVVNRLLKLARVLPYGETEDDVSHNQLD